MQNNVGIYASQISGHLWAPNGAYDALATTTVGAGGVASVTFAGIPQGYKHLQIRSFAKSTATVGSIIDVTFNSDTAANYSWHELGGNGTSAYADSSINRSNIPAFATIATTYTSIFSVGIMDILDYANSSKFKTTRCLMGYDLNASGSAIVLDSGNWRSTSAITSITLTPRANSIGQYSQFALYGVK